MATNPILESYGNAKIEKTDTSSRFGEFIGIHFTKSKKLPGCGDRDLPVGGRKCDCPEGLVTFHNTDEIFLLGVKEED